MLDTAVSNTQGFGLMEIDIFTGGIFDTNCYFLLKTGILIDAPQGAADWLDKRGYSVTHLLLTHGHIDHVWDGARIKEKQGCKVVCHAETAPMIGDPDFFLRLGFNWQIETFSPDQFISEQDGLLWNDVSWNILEVPGHCPGSLAFHQPEESVVFCGDALMAGSMGRTDLPGGDHALLVKSIQENLFVLPEDTLVLSGHGPATKIGIERLHNPYVGLGR